MTDNNDRRIAQDVLDERARQDAKWGQPPQLPDGTGADSRPLRAESGFNFLQGNVPAGLLAGAFQATTDHHTKLGVVTYADILLEEVFEALAESDPISLRAELIQVSAVAQKWVKVIDQRLEDEINAERAARRS